MEFDVVKRTDFDQLTHQCAACEANKHWKTAFGFTCWVFMFGFLTVCMFAVYRYEKLEEEYRLLESKLSSCQLTNALLSDQLEQMGIVRQPPINPIELPQ